MGKVTGYAADTLTGLCTPIFLGVERMVSKPKAKNPTKITWWGFSI